MNEQTPVNREEIEKILESQESFNAYLEVGGEAGMALGLVNFIVWLDGDEATDEECLELIEKTILYFNHRQEKEMNQVLCGDCLQDIKICGCDK